MLILQGFSGWVFLTGGRGGGWAADLHLDVATSLSNLALLYNDQGRYGAAEPLYLEALAIVVSSLGETHPKTVTVRQNFERFLQTVVEAQQTDRLSDHPLVQELLRQM